VKPIDKTGVLSTWCRCSVLFLLLSCLSACISPPPRKEALRLGQSPFYWGQKCIHSLDAIPFRKKYARQVATVVIVPRYLQGRKRFLNALVVMRARVRSEEDGIYLSGHTEYTLSSTNAVADLCRFGEGGGSKTFPCEWRFLCVYCGPRRELLGVAVLSQSQFAQVRDLGRARDSRGRLVSESRAKFWSNVTSRAPAQRTRPVGVRRDQEPVPAPIGVSP